MMVEPRRTAETSIFRKYLAEAGKRGEKLAVDWLRDTGSIASQVVNALRPYDDAGKPRKGAKLEECLKWLRVLMDAANHLAQYESPRLSAIAHPADGFRVSATSHISSSSCYA
jgi:hypothetical protein